MKGPHMPRLNVLVFGASYGSLFASRLLLAGHDATLACLPSEAELIGREGIRVRVPVAGREELVELDSRHLPGRLAAASPEELEPAGHDLVVLAMQEPHYGAPGVRELLEAVAREGLPCVSIMNMPPLTYLERVPGVDVEACRACYADPDVWDATDPALMTLCSPDPQAFRPPEEPDNVLQVRLATSFKAARFEADAHTALAPPGGRHRGEPAARGRRGGRAAGQAPAPRLGLRAAGEVGHAPRRQLPVHPAGRHPFDPGGGGR